MWGVKLWSWNSCSITKDYKVKFIKVEKLKVPRLLTSLVQSKTASKVTNHDSAFFKSLNSECKVMTGILFLKLIPVKFEFSCIKSTNGSYFLKKHFMIRNKNFQAYCQVNGNSEISIYKKNQYLSIKGLLDCQG